MVRLLRAAATGLAALVALYLAGLAVIAALRILVTQSGAPEVFTRMESELAPASVAGALAALALGLIFAPVRGDWRGLIGFAPAAAFVLVVLVQAGVDPLDVPVLSFLIAMLFVGTMCGMALAAMIWTRERKPIL
jgi:hypothetical protein